MWRWVRNTEHFVGSMDLTDERLWLRQLDYYAYLHEQLDVSLSRILSQLDQQDTADDTIVIYTSDHGDACGSHGLRAKLPCVYEEVLGVPLMIRAPSWTDPGAETESLSTHVDLAATIAAMGGAEPAQRDRLSGEDLSAVLTDPAAHVRDHVLFAQDSAQSELLRNSRYAVSGYFDGTNKYARYYGIGGGVQRDGSAAESPKVLGPHAAFDDQDHEWYVVGDDPDELVNRANDRAHRRTTRELFERLRELEDEAYDFHE
jgi:arylsulfatase A-like enzyme